MMVTLELKSLVVRLNRKHTALQTKPRGPFFNVPTTISMPCIQFGDICR